MQINALLYCVPKEEEIPFRPFHGIFVSTHRKIKLQDIAQEFKQIWIFKYLTPNLTQNSWLGNSLKLACQIIPC